MGLLITGLWTILNAILAILDSPSISLGTDSPTLDLSLLRLSNWIDLAALVGLSVLMFRLLPQPLAEWGPRHALRGIRRLIVAVALASTMMWPLDFARMLLGSLEDFRLGPVPSRTILIAIAIAVVVWLFTWRPPVRD